MAGEDVQSGGPLGSDPGAHDHKSYVDAVISAGQRSRAIIYFVLILVVLTLTSIRNSYSPDWMTARVSAYQDLYLCFKVHDLPNRDCNGLRERAQRAGLAESGTDFAAKTGKILGLEVRGGFADKDFLEQNKFMLQQVRDQNQTI